MVFIIVLLILYQFCFSLPSGLGFGRHFITLFQKCVSSNFSKKTNNPNPSPIKKIRFGLYWFGAGGRTRTGTVLLPVDFESTTSANSITPACPNVQFRILAGRLCSVNFPAILKWLKQSFKKSREACKAELLQCFILPPFALRTEFFYAFYRIS